MKCIRMVGQGIPCRLSDADAAQIIAEGDGEYCPKSVWKRFHDNNADERCRRRLSIRLTPTGRIISRDA